MKICECCGDDIPHSAVRTYSAEFGAEDYHFNCYARLVGDELDGFCDDLFRIRYAEELLCEAA